ncbi:hypothetical protein GOODEAATRI_032211 [Goodea atripinnis]|uniref:Uncharacterized protein n=1 Tax=Goodea atripinnis TaxID=208336 RepID=A0ABV0NFH4_9TELE
MLFLLYSVPPAASLMDIPTPEGPGTSRDPAPISHQLKESAYIFREGMLPPHRQMFYQLCDLDVDRYQTAKVSPLFVAVVEESSEGLAICDLGWVKKIFLFLQYQRGDKSEHQ